MAHSALTLWALGYPARAAARAEQALTLARSQQHPLSLVYANHFVAVLHQCRGDLETMQTLEDDVFAQATEHGLNFFLASGAIQRGWLLARRGHVDEGLAQMQLAIDASRKFGADLRIPAFLASMAEVYEKSGRPAEGLSVVSEAFTVAEQFGAHYYWTAELHRLKGALMLPSDEKAAEECFHDAIGIARRQGAKSLELRAAVSLSRLWAGQGKTREARTMLADVSAWFSEGLDTSDLAEANALLAELRS
jgi:predicted ATPase